LTETEYEESRIASLTPDWDRKLLALHTLQHEGNLTIIDGVLRRRKFF